MKRMISIALMLAMLVCLTSCGGEKGAKGSDKQSGESPEIALIVDSNTLTDGSFVEVTWESIKNFADTNGLSAKCYQTEEPTIENYMAMVQEAADQKVKLIVMAGNNFETTVYTAQSMYPDVYFLLIDGVPHDGDNAYVVDANTASILFAEEEAGFLAGYAAVKDGYTKLGFLGGQSLPSVKRYGYGFVQGAAAAAAELETNVEVRYQYTGTFYPSDDVKTLAAGWYAAGTEVIFACGGDMGSSVMAAAEAQSGKVIGVDIDQSSLSETVITSAKKNLAVAIEDMLKNYARDGFTGGTILNYAAKNDGVSLEMNNAQFAAFNKADYKKILKKMKNGEIELKKDTGVSALSELTGAWVTIVE